MKRFQYINYIICALILVFGGCDEDRNYIRLEDGEIPSPVTNIRVEPLPGGAKITYSIPPETSFRYVRAEYNIRSDAARISKSSNYVDFVTVDGFPDTEEYEVKLYSVNGGEKSSEPVVVKVNPLTPPLQEVRNTLTFTEAFGGVTINFENSGEAPMAIGIFTPDENNEWVEVDTYYSEAKNGRFTVRGFAAEERRFGAVVRDRFGSLSDTAVAVITPIFEEVIPKPFRAYTLPSDYITPHPSASYTIDKLWDERNADAVFHTRPGAGMPQHFTFDLGRKCTLSRYNLVHRGPGNTYSYKLGAPKTWEIYGSNDPTDEWDSWELLGTFESYKPSGNPVGTNTAEDNDYATVNGEDFEFPTDNEIGAVRYLRFRILETWDYLDYFYIAELSFWGRVEE